MSDGKTRGSKGLWNAAFSLLDPEIKKLAQRLAATIPADSTLRGELVERFIGVAKSLLETRADSLPAPFAAALEKLTDGADFFNVYLGGGERGEKGADEKWMEAFFGEATRRMSKAGNPTTEAARLEEEFRLRITVLKMIRDEQAKHAKPLPEVKPIDWGKRWEQAKKADASVAAAIDSVTLWVKGGPSLQGRLSEKMPAIWKTGGDGFALVKKLAGKLAGAVQGVIVRRKTIY